MSTPFDLLLAASLPRVHRAALGLLGDEQEAREIAQEALLRAHRARDRYDPARPFYPWLYRIVRNACADARDRRRHQAVSGLDSDRVSSPEGSALDAIGQREAIDRVRAAMETLTEEHREILSLRHFQDLSYSEIAQVLGLPKGTVMSRLYRARAALTLALEMT
ncbi:MAG: RNA polymerase sigma factor [Deltaproteobacteria bacterium]|nr:RNA polymerase sigma factor [Deltaproteobacteria bacterium]